MMLKIFLIGWIILIGALIINGVALRLQLSSWYGFADSIGKEGIVGAFQKTKIISLIFLFIIYPFLLGLCGYFGYRLIK